MRLCEAILMTIEERNRDTRQAKELIQVCLGISYIRQVDILNELFLLMAFLNIIKFNIVSKIG